MRMHCVTKVEQAKRSSAGQCVTITKRSWHLCQGNVEENS
jgi:hypothetical protein